MKPIHVMYTVFNFTDSVCLPYILIFTKRKFTEYQPRGGKFNGNVTVTCLCSIISLFVNYKDLESAS